MYYLHLFVAEIFTVAAKLPLLCLINSIQALMVASFTMIWGTLAFLRLGLHWTSCIAILYLFVFYVFYILKQKTVLLYKTSANFPLTLEYIMTEF